MTFLKTRMISNAAKGIPYNVGCWRPAIWRVGQVSQRRWRTSGQSATGHVRRRVVWLRLFTPVATLTALGTAVYYFLPSNSIYADAQGPSAKEDAIKERSNSGREFKGFRRASSATEKLTEHEESHILKRETGLKRYDTSQVSSNNPCEDEHTESIVPTATGTWSFFTILDGHAGWETSVFLREKLANTVLYALDNLYSQALDAGHVKPPASEVDGTITQVFKALDKHLIHERLEEALSSESRAAAVRLLAPAWAGSCALLAFYDSESGLLRTALTGDSRAVLGRRNKDGSFDVKVLTADQTGANPDEKSRLEAEHPDESVVKGSRVVGYGISRAFGDARTKWSTEVQATMKRKYLGRSQLPDVITPPYLIADPVITTTEIMPGDFVIMASDGLWECLSNDEAVGLVGWWLKRKGGVNNEAVLPREDLPLGHRDAEDMRVRYEQWGAEKKFTGIDDNVATHLIRNALGGADGDLTEALLSINSPRSRVYRDDITVSVIFFAEE